MVAKSTKNIGLNLCQESNRMLRFALIRQGWMVKYTMEIGRRDNKG